MQRPPLGLANQNIRFTCSQVLLLLKVWTSKAKILSAPSHLRLQISIPFFHGHREKHDKKQTEHQSRSVFCILSAVSRGFPAIKEARVLQRPKPPQMAVTRRWYTWEMHRRKQRRKSKVLQEASLNAFANLDSRCWLSPSERATKSERGGGQRLMK